LTIHLGETFSTAVVVRKWANIDPELEFRVFISKVKQSDVFLLTNIQGNVTGITQYHQKCFIKAFQTHEKEITSLILQNVEKVICPP
jgi:hypothetical protein